MGHISNPAGATILDNGIAWTGATLQSRKALLINVVGKSTEKLLETTSGGHIWPHTQTGSYTNPLDWWEVVHLVRNVLAAVQIVDRLSPWGLLCVRAHILQGWNLILGLKTPITHTTTKFGGHNFDILIVRPVITGMSHKIRIAPSNNWGGWFSGSRGYRHVI
jgi:hypothetical protein